MAWLNLIFIIATAKADHVFLLRPVRDGGTLARVLGHRVKPTRVMFGRLPLPDFMNVILGVGDSRLAIVRGRHVQLDTDKENFWMRWAPADSIWTRKDPEHTLPEPILIKVYFGGDGVLGPTPGRADPVLLEIGDDVYELLEPSHRKRPRVAPLPNPCGDRLVDA